MSGASDPGHHPVLLPTNMLAGGLPLGTSAKLTDAGKKLASMTRYAGSKLSAPSSEPG
jgi:hypothetical protein